MGRFRSFWQKAYEADLSESDEGVRKIISNITIQYQDFAYLPEAMLDEQTAKLLFDYIDACFSDGKKGVFYSAIFKAFRERFINTHINNPDMLKSYLSFALCDKYCIKKNYISVSSHVKIHLLEEISEFLIATGVPVRVESIVAEFSHIDENEVFWTLAGHNSSMFVRNSKGEYFHADIIQFTPEEIEEIKSVIQTSIDEKGYMGGKELTDFIDDKMPSIKERYPFLTWLGLRDVIAYKLSDSFSFKGKIISAYGQDLSMSDVFARFALTHEQFTTEQLNDLRRDLDTPIYYDSVYSNSLRISKDEFVSRKHVCFDTEAIDKAISRFCTEDYIALKEICFFGSFPYIGFSWNGFLLEHYVAYFSKEFMLLHLGFNASTPVGVVVNRHSEYKSFDDLVCAELSASNIPLIREDALQYLVDIGFIARKSYSGIDQVLVRAKAQRAKEGNQ